MLTHEQARRASKSLSLISLSHLRAPPVDLSRPRTETVSGQKRARAQNRAPGLELVHDLCVRARSLATFPLDVERAPDKIPLKKQVP